MPLHVGAARGRIGRPSQTSPPAADLRRRSPAPRRLAPSIDDARSTPVRRAWLDVDALSSCFSGRPERWLCLAYAIAELLAPGGFGRSAAPLHAPWVDEAHVLAEAFEIPGSIAVVESKVVTMPMVCGVWRPLIVMPQSAAQWSDERRRVVVLHELAHIKRRDCLTQVAGADGLRGVLVQPDRVARRPAAARRARARV